MRSVKADKIASAVQALFAALDAGEIDQVEFQRRADELTHGARHLEVVQSGSRFCVKTRYKRRPGQ